MRRLYSYRAKWRNEWFCRFSGIFLGEAYEKFLKSLLGKFSMDSLSAVTWSLTINAAKGGITPVMSESSMVIG